MERGRPARRKERLSSGAKGGAGGCHVVHQDRGERRSGWGCGVKSASEIARARLPRKAALGRGGAVAPEGRQEGEPRKTVEPETEELGLVKAQPEAPPPVQG